MGTGLFLGLLVLVGRDSVYGVVRDAVSGRALADVAVVASSGAHVVTDGRGAYALPAADSGSRTLCFTRAGFEPFDVDVAVAAERSLRLDVGLHPLPVTLPPLHVSTPMVAATPESRSAAEIGLRRYTSETLRSDPLASPTDPVLAAASETVDAWTGTGGVPRMHGGSADQNLVLLDGLPVYGLTHLGGRASVFDPDLVGQVDLHGDVPPAEYGGRLSSVIAVDLRPVDPGGLQVAGSASSLALRQSLSTPLGANGSLQAAIGRSYRGVFPGDETQAEQNGFGDALVHASLGGPRDLLSAYFVNGADNLAFGAASGISPVPTQLANGFDWSHQTTGLVWRRDIDARHALTVRAWQARADARIAWSLDSVQERVTSTLREPGVSVQIASGGSGGSGGSVVAGVSLSRPSTSYTLATTSAERAGSAVLALRSAPWLAAAYGEGDWRIGPAAITAGLRAQTAQMGAVFVDPRLSASFELGRGLSAGVGYSQSRQFVQSLRNEESPIGQAFDGELPLAVGSGGLSPASGQQLSAEIALRTGMGSRARLYGYTRSLDGVLAVPAVTGGPFARSVVPAGRGKARGLEAEFARSGARFDLHAVLGIETSRRQLGDAFYAPGALRSRWLLAGAGYHLDDQTAVRLAGTIATGAPTTPVTNTRAWDPAGVLDVGEEIMGSPETAGPLNHARLPTYWRLDAGVIHDWRLRALGQTGALTTSAVLTNLLGVRNPLAYTLDPTGVRRALDFPSRALDLQLSWRF
ncbi:MAG: carboxypeptidase regulatory-like domain-containing protein [Gemmatimonadales bacterium]